MPDLMIANERQVYDRLNATIEEAHDDGRLDRLAACYAEGGALYERQGETDAACFFWTQAYIFALDAGAAPSPMRCVKSSLPSDGWGDFQPKGEPLSRSRRQGGKRCLLPCNPTGDQPGIGCIDLAVMAPFRRL